MSTNTKIRGFDLYNISVGAYIISDVPKIGLGGQRTTMEGARSMDTNVLYMFYIWHRFL